MVQAAGQRSVHVLALLSVFVIALASVACAGGGGSSSTSSGASQTPISVSFSVPATPTVSVQADIGTQNFTAAVSGDSRNKGVNFTLFGSGCNGSSCGTLTNTTLTSVTYIAPATQPSSTVILTAASVADPSKTATVTITVTPAVVVSVSPAGSQSVQASIGTRNFTATVANDSQNAGVTWTLVGSGCNSSTCGTISATSSSSGAPITYTAPLVPPSPADVTLTATSVTDKNQSFTTIITVSPPISVSVSAANQSVHSNATVQVTATVAQDAQNKGVQWALTSAGLPCASAQCGALSSTTSLSGVAVTYLPPIAATSPFQVTLTATSVADPLQSGFTTLDVAPAISIAISPSPGLAQVTQTDQFNATLQYDLTNAGVTWSLSDFACGNSAACGVLSNFTPTSVSYTAPGTISTNPATFTLTATSIADPTRSASIPIRVSSQIPIEFGWFEIPNTSLISSNPSLTVCPSDPAIHGADGCQSVISAWGGGAADTVGNRLLFTGGGHENYAGNEVYALDLKSSPIALVRVNNPVFPSPIPDCMEDWGPPATPSPRETYGNLTYISDANKMWNFGGAPFTNFEPCRSGGMWTLDFSVTPPLWTQLNQTLTILPTRSIDLGASSSIPWINGGTETDINYADYLPVKAGDPLSGMVYVYLANSDILASYDPVTNTLTTLSTGEVVPQRHTGQTQIRANGVLDPVRHIFLIVGEGTLGWFDLNTLNASPPAAPPFIDRSVEMGSGDCGSYIDPLNSTSLQDLNSPGLAYDSVADRVIGWAGGNTIYVIDTTQALTSTTMSCKVLTTYPGGPPQTPLVPAQPSPTGAQYNGTFGRFRYFPALDVFAVVNDAHQNAFTFRMPNPLPPGY